VASSLYPFDGLLICSAAPDAQLKKDRVRVAQIIAGGSLHDTQGKQVHPGAASVGDGSFLQGSTDSEGPLAYDAVEVGVLADFLSNDAWYPSNAHYARFELLHAHPATAALARALTQPASPNCVLLSSDAWALHTRYEITLAVKPTPGVAPRPLLTQHPVWIAPLLYERMDTVPRPPARARPVPPSRLSTGHGRSPAAPRARGGARGQQR
jgi:hypothetical protein